MPCRLCVLPALALVVAAGGCAETAPTRTNVVNGRDAPVPVLEQTILQPVQGTAGRILEKGERSTFLDLVTPPGGKMIVLQYITIRVDTQDKTANALFELWGLLEGRSFIHYLDALPPPISVGVWRGFQQMLTQHVLVYSTGPVALRIDRGSKNTAVSSFEVSFSGYLVEAP
jgi:hypothetical protein